MDPDYHPIATANAEPARSVLLSKQLGGTRLRLFNALRRALGVAGGVPLTARVREVIQGLYDRGYFSPRQGEARLCDMLLHMGVLTDQSPEEDELRFWMEMERTAAAIPQVSLLEVTTRCQMTCSFCGHGAMARPKRHMSMRDYRIALSRVAETGQDSISLYGYGEPLLHPEVVECVRMASARGLAVALSTVPVYLTEALSRDLLDAGLREISFSIDSLQPATFRALRGNNADLERAMQNVLAFLALNRERDSPALTQVRMVSVPENAGEEHAFVEYWRSLGVDTVYVRPYVHLHRRGMARAPVLAGSAPAAAPGAGWESRRLCDWPWRAVVLWETGQVSACCLDLQGELAMGDWRESTLPDIWRSARYGALRSALRTGQTNLFPACSGCRHSFARLREYARSRHGATTSTDDIPVVAWEF